MHQHRPYVPIRWELLFNLIKSFSSCKEKNKMNKINKNNHDILSVNKYVQTAKLSVITVFKPPDHLIVVKFFCVKYKSWIISALFQSYQWVTFSKWLFWFQFLIMIFPYKMTFFVYLSYQDKMNNKHPMLGFDP